MKRKVLVIGKGAREHAICKKLASEGHEVHCIPGNPGIVQIAICHPDVATTDFAQLVAFVKSYGIEITVVGSEDPLNDGIVNYFSNAGLRIVGPTQQAALVEASKAFLMSCLRNYNIPAPRTSSHTFSDMCHVVRERGVFPTVLKYDGLALGKGVEVVMSVDELPKALERLGTLRRALAEAQGASYKDRWLIQEYLGGDEISIFVLTDGTHGLFIGSAADYKRLQNGDHGPNTGGMGGFAPHHLLTEVLLGQIMETIAGPTIKMLGETIAVGGENGTRKFRGIMYFQLKLTSQGPKVVEINCRFGDPEAQLVLPLLDCDLLPMLEATTADGELIKLQVRFKNKFAVGVVLASQGYPDNPLKGDDITSINHAEARGILVFQAGTARTPQGTLVTAGGRVLTVVAVRDYYMPAMADAIMAAQIVHFRGKQFRTDIGMKIYESVPADAIV